MNVFRRAAIAAASLALTMTTPAFADDGWPIDPGDYVEMAMIKVDDGHSLDYANHLAGMWRNSQDFAKSKGWISNYQIWVNTFAREDEADVYLVTWFPKMADAAEEMRRDKEYEAHMKMTATQMQAASGKRAEYRHLAGSQLFRVYNWKK
ncbi:MAG: hypothetical protein KDE55_03910 [Novosphingobium sp.]|nr:hypothetical protein [Novosphingobium sp.]